MRGLLLLVLGQINAGVIVGNVQDPQALAIAAAQVSLAQQTDRGRSPNVLETALRRSV